ncbi:DUF4244 domain-containing protein [Arthrobacter ruber]|uniref:DUF4244 domain-containing protein n=1 Tax=Arthrobacter ruber TaxID=1258893 RepID=UPI001F0B817E|nr:DUF4244 domain-containing protein [Arthrobacter ruber]
MAQRLHQRETGDPALQDPDAGIRGAVRLPTGPVPEGVTSRTADPGRGSARPAHEEAAGAGGQVTDSPAACPVPQPRSVLLPAQPVSTGDRSWGSGSGSSAAGASGGTRSARREEARRRRSNEQVIRRSRNAPVDREAGMATAEYAIATLAAVGFAALLVAVLSSGEVRGLLMSLITSALSFG